jgi:hypothetical protein
MEDIYCIFVPKRQPNFDGELERAAYVMNTSVWASSDGKKERVYFF